MSLEFSILALAVLVLSVYSITHFLNNSFSEEDRTIDKIDIAAKTAVSMVNSGYNGTSVSRTISYSGVSWNKVDDGTYNVTIYIRGDEAEINSVEDFIINYIVESQNIDPNKYDINIIVQ
jgi:uncharacterized protein (UPF0333 family)